MELGNSLVALSQMLGGSTEYQNNDTIDDDNEFSTPAQSHLTPAQIGPPKSTSKPVRKEEAPKVKSKDIWDAEEVPVSGYGADDDPRKRPEYDILYKQAVTAEDMFIGLSGRDPSSGSCEDLVVRITLPDTNRSQIELDITPLFLDLRTPVYRLGLHLPHPVDDKTGNAKWDPVSHVLAVTLRLKREYDFLRS